MQLLQGDGDFLGESDADEPAGGDRIAIADQPDGIRCRHDLALLHALKCGQQRMSRIRHQPMLLLINGDALKHSPSETAEMMQF
jgi:hypothetical protein